MNDQSPNSQFKASSFMQGHNAEYLEQLYAQYAQDPKALDETWQNFFEAMGDDEVSIKREAEGPSWGRRDWPPALNDDLTAAMDGQWAPDEEANQIAQKINKVAEEKNIEISNDAIQRARCIASLDISIFFSSATLFIFCAIWLASSSGAHWPSIAAVRSSFRAGGQSRLPQLGPSASLLMLTSSSPIASKKFCQVSSRALGSCAYCAYSCSKYSALCPCIKEEALNCELGD